MSLKSPTDTQRFSALKAAIAANGGHIVTAEAAKVWRLGRLASDQCLRRLMLAGVIARTRVGLSGGITLSHWHLPGHVVEVKSARQDVLDLLASGPKTRPEICEAMGKTLTGANTLLHRMKSEGLVESRGRGLNGRWAIAGQMPPDRPAPARKPTQAQRMSGPVVVPDGLEVQRGKAWTHDVRFQLAPEAAASFRGEFSRMGPGRYLQAGG